MWHYIMTQQNVKEKRPFPCFLAFEFLKFKRIGTALAKTVDLEELYDDIKMMISHLCKFGLHLVQVTDNLS